MRSLILQLFAIVSIQAALERPIPSMLLQPRDFNPHPFQEEAKRFLIAVSDHEDLDLEQKLYHLAQRFRNTGPVKFPDSDPDIYAQRQLQQARHQRVVSHIVNQQAIQSPQYQRIALTRRPKKMRIVTTNPYEAARLLSALSHHGRRVQNNEFQQQQQIYTPTSVQHALPPATAPPAPAVPIATAPPRQRHYPQPIIAQQHYLNRIDDDEEGASPSNHEEKKHYKFAYAVKDRSSGDDFSHVQKQENGAVRGSYKVRLPDGRIQTTKYTADDSGYHADVTYEDDGAQFVSSAAPQAIDAQPQLYYAAQPSSSSNGVRYTVTPTPINQYNHIRAPTIPKSYSSTTAIPNYY